jgi:predicted phosphate transport protein (TIGR00153 family)
MRLLPREEKFYHYFNEQASLIMQAADLLLTAARSGNDALTKAADDIGRLESKGDEIIHEIFTKLNQTFITPIDPEDIHSLGSHLDDVLDGIEDSVHRMVSYRVEPIPPAIPELCGIIRSCAENLTKAFVALADDKPLLEHCIEINRLEDQADQVVRRHIGDLFRHEQDTIRLIKLKEIYEYLEQTTDYCEDVADALQNVVVKNS